MKIQRTLLLSILFMLGIIQNLTATHIVGSTINYKYLGGNKYEIKVVLYRDCRVDPVTGKSLTVAAPKNVTVKVRRGDDSTFDLVSTKRVRTLLSLPLPNDPCVKKPDVEVCVEQYEYTIVNDQFKAGFDYYLFFSLCCRNSTIINLNKPASTSEVIYTKIPDRNVFPNLMNAKFTIQPPSYVCGGKSFTVNNFAYDSGNGDKLVYQLYTPNSGNQKQIDTGGYIPTVVSGLPVFIPVNYSTTTSNGKSITFTGNNPMAANEVIVSDSGKLTFNANIYGQFVVGVKVQEYRGATLISETMRDYQYNVVKCPPPDIAKLVLPNMCKSMTGTFQNSFPSADNTSFLWKFNDAGKAPKDTSILEKPSFTFSKPGIYKIKLTLNPGTNCARSDSQNIVVTNMQAAYSTDGIVCAGTPAKFFDKSTITVGSTITGWSWNFGDGATSNLQNPTHVFTKGGDFKVKLVVTNNFGCTDTVFNMIKSIKDEPVAVAGVDDTLCKNNPTATLNGVIKFAGGGLWKGGLGTFNPDRTTLTAKYTPTTTELTTGNVILTLLTTNNGVCGADSTKIKLSYSESPQVFPEVSTYPSICSNNLVINLFGAIKPDKMGFGAVWSGFGGKISDPTDFFAVYTPSNAERVAGSVKLTLTSTNNKNCLPVSASTTIKISPSPVVKAGNDTTVCANNADVKLKATVTLTSKFTWRTGGDGTFGGSVTSTSSNPIYTPGPNDKANGQVQLFLTTPPAASGSYPANCLPVEDTILVTITPAPIVKLGSDLSVCENNPKISLTGKVTTAAGSGTGIWSNGNGNYSPDNKSLKLDYTLSNSEIAAKKAMLILTSTNNGKCLAVSDTINIKVTPSPIVSVGTTQVLCKNNASIKLNGSVTGGASTGVWTGGKGKYTADSTVLKATYTPSSSEITAGTVTLTLKATNFGTCLVETKNITYTFNDLPKIDAGSPVGVCSNKPNAQLNASIILGAKSVKWSGGSGKFTPSDTILNPVYEPVADEITAGKLVLTATSLGNGNCLAVSDSVSIKFHNSPTLTLGTYSPVCANNPILKLNEDLSKIGNGEWSSSTGGKFSPSANANNPTYLLSKQDSASSSFKLKYTSKNSGVCSGASEELTVKVVAAPVVNAGPRQNICSNNPSIKLAGFVSGGASAGIWSGGSNVFNGGNTNLSATYIPSASEISSGKVTLTLTGTSNGNCSAVSDTVTFYFTPAPSLTVSDINVCGDVDTVGIVAVGNGIPTAVDWVSDGTGNINNRNEFKTFYKPSQIDKDRNSVKLTVTSTSQGNCKPVDAKLNIIFSPKSVVNAGGNQNLCTADSSVQLLATGTAGIWTSASGGTFKPSANVANPKYYPSASDLSAKSATLTYTSNAKGPCKSVSDNSVITILSSPSITLSSSDICSDDIVKFSITKSNVSAFKWNSTGSGSFIPDDVSEIVTYKPSGNEITSRKAILSLTGNSSLCGSVTKNVTVNILPKYDVIAGGNQTVCSDITSIQLNGSRSGSFPVLWTSSGSGKFSSDTSLNAKYIPSPTDLTAKTFDLTLSSTGTGCTNKSSKLTVSVLEAPKIDAGSNISICNDSAFVSLKGTLLNAQAKGATWSTKAGGVINPNGLIATYFPKLNEFGTFKFYLTTTDNGLCNAVKDSLTLTISDKPTLAITTDSKICADEETIVLSADVTNAKGATWSIVTGNGTILDPLTPTPIYVIDDKDRANGLVSLRIKTIASANKCKPIEDLLVIDIQPAVKVNAGDDVQYCSNVSQVPVTATVSVADSIEWTTLGTGTFVNKKFKSTFYKPSPLDITNKEVELVLIAKATKFCSAKRDTIKISFTPVPVLTVPSDFTVCADSSFIQLSGSSSTGSVAWSSDGGNNFSPNAFDVNAKFVPNTSDIAAGKIKFTLTSKNNGSCLPVSNSFTVSISDSPTLTAGGNQVVCADVDGVKLNPTFSVATGVIWTSSGSGVFSSTGTGTGNIANDTYKLSNTDTAAGQVTLKVTTIGTGKCKPVTDKVVIKITPAPFVDAGPASVVQCGDLKAVNLFGVIGNSKGGKWTSSGTGKFAPNDSTITTAYLITSADSALGKVDIFYSSTGVGTCKVHHDTLKLTITPAPKVSVNDDFTICSDKDTINLVGSSIASKGVKWTSSGAGPFAPKVDTTNVIYKVTAADKLKGSVSFSMTATGIGTCKKVSDSLKVTITNAPTIEAGVGDDVCASVTELNLNGKMTVSNKAVWKTSGTGTFSDSTILNSTYFPSAADKAVKSVILTLSTTDNGFCQAISDKITYKFTPVPELTVGADQTVCSDVNAITLTGTVKNATGAIWLVPAGGSGTFDPDNITGTVRYIDSAFADNTTLEFKYMSVGNDKCAPVYKSTFVKLLPKPVVVAGNAKGVCSDAPSITLDGTIVNAGSGVWSSTGKGNLVTVGIDLKAVYTPDAADIARGSVKFTLTSKNNNGCKAYTDSVIVPITPAPSIVSIPNVAMCADADGVDLKPNTLNSGTFLWQTTSGTGSFTPSNTVSDITFKPSQTQIDNGKAVLTLILNGKGDCALSQTSASATVSISQTPKLSISDISTCEGSATVDLNAILNNNIATAFKWTSLSKNPGFSFTSPTSLATKYNTSAGDRVLTNDSIGIRFETTAQGLCKPFVDTLFIHFVPTSNVSAGTDQTICTNVDSVRLSASGSVGFWSKISPATGGTFQPNINALNASYFPSADDKIANKVLLKFTSTPGGTCTPKEDTIEVTINQGPTFAPVSSGPTCANADPVSIDAKNSAKSIIRWFTDGTGSFGDSLNPVTTYTPSASDISSGQVTLKARLLDDAKICKPEYQNVEIVINTFPEVYSGSDFSVCANIPKISLGGKVSKANVGIGTWTILSASKGSFSSTSASTSTKLDDEYVPSAGNISDENVKLLLTSHAATCKPVTDTLTITFTDAPTVKAGTSGYVCGDTSSIPLVGSVTVVTGGQWSHNGLGAFSDTNKVITNYLISDEERNNGAKIDFTLSSYEAGTCVSVKNTIQVEIKPRPVINVGTDVVACGDTSFIDLNGSVSNVGGGLWSIHTGSGLFGNGLKTTSNLKDKYVPSVADRVSDEVILKLVTTDVDKCKPINDFKHITFTPIPKVEAGFDFSLCGNNSLMYLEGSKSKEVTSGFWSTLNDGMFLTKKDSLITTYKPSKKDSLTGNVVFVLTSKGTGICKAVSDTLNVSITKVPVITLSTSDINICADSNLVELKGNAFTVANGISWSTSGNGSFIDPLVINPTYQLVSKDRLMSEINFIISTEGNSNCLPVVDTVILKIAPLPQVFAGNDTTICSNSVAISLRATKNATVTETNWSSDGTSSFKGSTTGLSATFEPKNADRDKGQIAFTIISTKQGLCKPVSDVKVVSFEKEPNVKVNAGLPTTVCASNSILNLSGKMENANKSIWTSLTSPIENRGVFEDSLKLNSLYQPSISELGSGTDTSFVILRLSAFNTIGTCAKGVSSDLLVTILPNPKIDFSDPSDTLTVCADKDTVNIKAVAKIADKVVPGFWTTNGTGVFEKNAFASSTTYRLSANDRLLSQVAFAYKSDGNAGCDTVTKYKILKIIPAVPTVDAGKDQIICANNALINLLGKVTVASKFGWHVFPLGGTFSPDSNKLATSFLPTANTIKTGAMKIKLRSHGPESCKDVTDELLVRFTLSPTVVIKPTSIEICADTDSLELSAEVQNSVGGIWATTGNGQFIPNANTVNAVYLPSEEDKINGTIKLKLTSLENGFCTPVSDSVVINIRKAPIVSDTAFGTCVSQTGIKLKSSSSTGSGNWSTSGFGSFSPNPNDVNATYFPSFDDFNIGEVQLTFTSLNNKTCKPVSKSVGVNVSPLPIADAGKDQIICKGTSTIISALYSPKVISYNWNKLPAGTSNDSLVIGTGNLVANSSYKLSVVDAKGCENSDTVVVKVIEQPLLKYSSPFCIGDLTLKPSIIPVDTLNGIFQWYRDNSILVRNNRSSIVPDREGIYKNVFTIANCEVSADTKVNPLPVLDGLNRIVCHDLTGFDITMLPVQPSKNVFTWSSAKYNGGVASPISGSKATINTSIGSDTIVYYATVKDSVNCTSTDSIIVFPVPSPIFSKVIDTTVCAGVEVELDANPKNIASDRISYLWSPSGETSAKKKVSASSGLAKSDTATFIVKFTLGECIVPDTAHVITNPNPNPDFPDLRNFCSDNEEDAVNQVVVLDAGSSGKIKWNTGDTTRRIIVSKEGFYKVDVVNKFNCKGSDSVTVVEKCKPRVYVPTAFSPNGDGKNDVFRIFGNKFVKNLKLIVFNRWGEIIFFIEDINGDQAFDSQDKVYSWDGEYRGTAMPIGPYPFVLTYEGKDEEFKGPYKVPGSVSLIR